MNAMFQAPPVLRLRRFLHQQGIRLRPWASETEILDSFYAQLAQRHADREFWERLKEVCGALAADLQHRQPDSELLRSLNTDVAGLVEDVRRALVEAGKSQSGFHLLNRLLPSSAMALLLTVSLAAVGCGGKVDHGYADGEAGQAGAAGSAGSSGGGGVAGTAGTSGSGGTAGVSGSSGTGGSSGCSAQTMEQLVRSCVTDTAAADAYLQALAASNSTWPQGLAAYFDCRSCAEISSYVTNCYQPQAQSGGYAGDPWAMCTPVMIYLGVSFA